MRTELNYHGDCVAELVTEDITGRRGSSMGAHVIRIAKVRGHEIKGICPMDEELAFIINYDIKYRMGRKS